MLLFGAYAPAFAQQDGVLLVRGAYSIFLERMHLAGHLPAHALFHRSASAQEAQRWLAHIDTTRLSSADLALLRTFLRERESRRVQTLGRLVPFAFPNGEDLFGTEGDGYRFEISPLLYLGYGKGTHTQDGVETQGAVWHNTRGIRAAGEVGGIFFDARLEENQRSDLVRTARSTERHADVQNYGASGEALDYYRATGIVGTRWRGGELRAGRDRHQWGPGLSSLMLSDHASPYEFVGLTLRHGAFTWQQMLAEFIDRDTAKDTLSRFPSRFGAMQRVEYSPHPAVTMGVFESYIAIDTSVIRGYTERSLLHPGGHLLQALRTTPRAPSARMLGAYGSVRVHRGMGVYGQLVHQSRLKNRPAATGWMAGVRWTDILLPNLSGHIEYARLDPFLYTHATSGTSYRNQRGMLGHPAGPNSSDVSFRLAYQPHPDWQLAIMGAHTVRGRNMDLISWGGNAAVGVLEKRVDVVQDVRFLEGIRQREHLLEAHLTYTWLPNLSTGVAMRYERLEDALTPDYERLLPMVILQWGVPYQSVRW